MVKNYPWKCYFNFWEMMMLNHPIWEVAYFQINHGENSGLPLQLSPRASGGLAWDRGTFTVRSNSSKLGTQARYPLVNQHNELENHHAINRKNHYFYGHFPVRFLYVYQRLPPFPRSTGPIQQPQAHLTSSLSKTGRWPFKHLTRLWASCWEIYWIYSHDESMVLLYMVTWIPSIYPSHVSIYTSIMDPMD